MNLQKSLSRGERAGKNECPHSEQEEHDRELKVSSARGGMVTLGSQTAQFLIRMVATVVLARILTPEDFGLVAMVAVIMGFAGIFKDLGLSIATIQSKDITREQVSTLFWINFAISVVLLVLFIALAPVLAWFYGEARLSSITIVLSLSFIFGGLTIQHQALLRRFMRFGSLATIEVISLLVGVVVALSFAAWGFGVWSLVAWAVTSAFSSFALTWAVVRWIPGLPSRNSGVRPFLSFGGNVAGFGIVNYLARNADNLLIGWHWGPIPLGFYSKAYQLLMFPLQQINAPLSNVAIPLFSRLREQPDVYRQAYLNVLQKIALLTVPMVVFLAINADWVVDLFLGSQWTATVPIFTWLSLAALAQPMANTTGWLFVSQGRSRDFFHWGVASSGVIVFSFCIGLPWGALGVAKAYSLFYLLTVPFLFWFVGRKGPVRARDFYSVMRFPVVVALIVGTECILFRVVAPTEQPLVSLLLSASLAMILALGTLISFAGGRQAILESIRLITMGLKPSSDSGGSVLTGRYGFS